MDENSGAVSLDLTPDEARELSDAAAKITPESNRYPEHLEAITGR